MGAMRTLEEAPFLDPFGEEFQADPFGNVDRARAESWLVRTPLGVLVVAREQVHKLLSDPRLQSALMQIMRLQGVNEGRLYDLVASALLSIDGPDHARIRGLVSRTFTPRAVEPYRPSMRALAEELVERFVGTGECEFMADFADHYPIEVMCQLLGVPPEDHLRFARWGDDLTHVLSLELSVHLDEVNEAVTGLNDYLDGLITERQAAPRQDLVSQLIAAGDDGDRLNPLELRALLGGLLFAGYDTTRNQLALAMAMFCTYPDQWRLLADRPELVASAVEEVMRVAGVISATPRVAVEDVELDGWRIPAWTLVLLSLSAANHDPAAFEDPHGFDITAQREQQLTFGGGPHFCLGANLARAEMQEALPVLARRLGPIALAGEPQWRPTIGTGIFGPTRLPLWFSLAKDRIGGHR
jgi:cytochrome P450